MQFQAFVVQENEAGGELVPPFAECEYFLFECRDCDAGVGNLRFHRTLDVDVLDLALGIWIRVPRTLSFTQDMLETGLESAQSTSAQLDCPKPETQAAAMVAMKPRRGSLPASPTLLPKAVRPFRDEMGLASYSHNNAATCSTGNSGAVLHSAPLHPTQEAVKRQRKKWSMEETQMLVDGCNCVSTPFFHFTVFQITASSTAWATGRLFWTIPNSSLKQVGRQSISKIGASLPPRPR